MAYDTTVRRASEILGISPQAVHKRIGAGTLPAVKSHGGWMVDGDAVRASAERPPVAGRPRSGRVFTLCNGPYEVMDFTYREANASFEPLEVADAARAPIGAVTRNGRGSRTGLRAWWEHRCIPESREGMDAKLRELGVADPAAIPFRNLGLSLSDQYWIRPAGESIRWEDVNYFRNSFGIPGGADAGGAAAGGAPGSATEDDWDGWLSLVGLSSPDNTSEGALPKKWVCRGDERLLCKGHAAWTDQQPFNEAVATLLHTRLLRSGDFVPYRVERHAGAGAMSVCPCFLGADEEYVTADAVLERGGRRRGEPVYDALVRCARNLQIDRKDEERALSQLIVCDGILANEDRHLRNFGFIRNIHTLEWRPAPLFDSGNCLWFDRDEDAVALRDHTFASRPFDAIPNRQLYLAGPMDWLDPAALDGFAEEACELLSDSVGAMWRLDYIREGIEERIAAVLSMR